jgi:hypothetical protein
MPLLSSGIVLGAAIRVDFGAPEILLKSTIVKMFTCRPEGMDGRPVSGCSAVLGEELQPAPVSGG